jgi:hypothetical protein
MCDVTPFVSEAEFDEEKISKFLAVHQSSKTS